jgi:hypothetical protein
LTSTSTRPKTSGSGRHDVRRSVGVHEVDRHVHELAVERVELRRAGARRADDARTLVEERAGDGETDALGGTGNDDDVVCELKVHAHGTPRAGAA